MLQAVSQLPVIAEWHWFGPVSIHVGYVVDKVALGQVRPRVQTLPDLRDFMLRNFRLTRFFKKVKNLDNNIFERRADVFLAGINPLKAKTNLNYI
jgi:hypothetical protein